ncbi:MAG: radical SAM protein [Thermodesulfobacteriota bacterium]
MKKVLFITLYDEICYGVRLLSSIVKQCGLESHLLIFKGETSYVPIWTSKDEYSTYQYFFNGLLRGSMYAVDPITPHEIKLMLSLIGQIKPDAICLSTRSFAYEPCSKIFPLIKQEYADIPIVAGGWGPTLEPERFLEFSDYVCFGEGEAAIRDLCSALLSDTPLTKATNLIYHDTHEIARNPVAPPISSREMNLLPFPDFAVENKYVIHKGKLRYGKEFYNEKVYDCFAARGCPLNCTYCLSGKYNHLYKEHSGQFCAKYRLRSIDVVLQEVSLAKERGAKFIRFKDEVFPISPAWVREFLLKYKTQIGLPFFAFIRPEFHSPDTIKELKNVGLCVTMVGIQSGSQEIRENLYRRQLSASRIVEFAQTLREVGVDFSYHLIYRNPFETERHLQEGLDFSSRLPCADTFIFKLQPFPGTPIYQMIQAENPQGLPANVHTWYALLLSMILKGPRLRKAAIFLRRHGFGRKRPYLLSIPFLPYLLKELAGVIKNRIAYNAKLHFAPRK